MPDPIQPIVPVTSIDLNKVAAQRTSGPATPALPAQPIVSGLPVDISTSGYQPITNTVANKDLTKVRGYNDFQNNPTYNNTLDPMSNVREYAAKQGTGEWLGNSFAKLGYLAKDSFIDAANQNIRNAKALRHFDTTELYNHDNTSDIQEIRRNELPTYGTGELDDSFKRFLPWNFGKSDFGGEMIPQLGFTVGTIGETLIENAAIGFFGGLATGGAGTAYEIANTGSKLSRLGTGLNKLFETANGITQFKRGLAILNTVEKEGGLGVNLVKGAKSLANFYSMYNVAASEAAFEANNTYTDQLGALTDEYVAKNGHAPIGNDLKEIQDIAHKTGLSTMVLNLPILLGSNLVQFGNIIKPFRGAAAEAAKDVSFELAEKGLKTTIKRTAEKEIENKILRAFSKTGKFLAEPASEMGEEVSQSLVSNATSGYYKNIYRGLTPGNSMSEAVNAMWDYSFSNSFWDDAAGGFYGGAIFKGIGAVSEATGLQEKMGFETEKTKKVAKDKIASEVENTLSTISTEDLAKFVYNPDVQNFLTQTAIKEKLNNAVLARDILAYNDARGEAVREAIYKGLTTGKLDIVLSQLDVLGELDEDEIGTLRNTTDKADIKEAKSKAAQIVTEIRDRATFLESNWNKLNQKYKNNYAEGTPHNRAFERAKRDRLFAMDAVEQDKKTANNLRNDITSSTDGVVTSNILDQAIDQNLLTKQVEDLDYFVNNAPDKTDPIFKTREKQLASLKEIEKERAKQDPDYKKISDLVFELGMDNTQGSAYFANLNRDEALGRIQDLLKVENRNKKNIQDYLVLNNEPISVGMRAHMEAEKMTLEAALKAQAPKATASTNTATNTTAPQITVTGDIKKDSELLRTLTKNSTALITKVGDKFRAATKNGTTTSTVGVDYNTIEDLFADINQIKTLIPEEVKVQPNDHSDNLEDSQENLVAKQPIFEDGIKDETVMYQSSTRPRFESRDTYGEALYRDEYLFDNVFNGRVQGNIVSIPVTAGNRSAVEAALFGSAGNQLDFLDGDAKYHLTAANLEAGAVNFIYARQTSPTTYELVDKNGNAITGDYKNNVVFSRLAEYHNETTATTGQPKFRTGTPEQTKKDIKEAGNKIRQHFLDNPTFQTYPFSISLGFDNKSKTFVTNSAVQTGVIDASQINDKTIHIGTAVGIPLHDNTTQRTIVGRPYIKKVGRDVNGKEVVRYQYLDNTNLSDSEVRQVSLTLEKLSERVVANKSMTTKDLKTTPEYIYLSGVLQLTTNNPKNQRQARIYINKKGELKVHIATVDAKSNLQNFHVDYASDEFKNWVKQRYHNVNKELLGRPFRDMDGNTYKTYTHYLLGVDEKNGVLDRHPLTVRMPIPTPGPQPELPYIQRYAQYDLKPITGEVKIEAFKKVTVGTASTPAQASTSGVSSLRSKMSAAKGTTNNQPAGNGNAPAGKGSDLRNKMKQAKTPASTNNTPSGAASSLRDKMNKAKGVPEDNQVTSFDSGDLVSGYRPTPEEEAANMAKPHNRNPFDPEGTNEVKPQKVLSTIDNQLVMLGYGLGAIEGMTAKEKDEAIKDGLNAAVAAPETATNTTTTSSSQTTATVSDDLDDLDAAPFRLERVAEETTEGITQNELDELKRMLPQVGLSLHPEMPRVFQGWRVWGSYKNKIISLYNGAVKGTVFHEAFETVFNSILNKKEQKALITEFKKRGGEFLPWDAKETNQTIRRADATDLQAKEAIADEFIDWKEKKDVGEANKNFFQKLWAYITDFVKSIFSPAYKVYNNLNRGRYATTALRDTLGEYFQFGGNESTEFEYLKSFSGLLFNKMNTEAVNILAGLDDGKYSEAELYNYLYNTAHRLFNPTVLSDEEQGLTDLEKQALVTERKGETSMILKQRASYIFNNDPSIEPTKAGEMSKEEFREAKQFFNETLTHNWDMFIQSHKNFLSHFGIGFTDINNEKEEEANKNQDNKTRDYVADPLRNDVKDSVSNSVKLVLATITDSMFFKSKLDASVRQMDIISSVTGLPNIVTNYNKLFNRLLSHLSGYNNEEVIRQKLQAMSEMTMEEKRVLMGTPIANIRAQFKQVYDKIFDKPMSELTSSEDIKLRLNFVAAFAKQAPQFLRNKISDDGGAYFADEYFERIAKNAENKAINNIRNAQFTNGGKEDYWLKRGSDTKFFVNKKLNQFGEVARASKDFQDQLINGLNALGFDTFNKELLESLSYGEVSDLLEQYNNIAAVIRGFSESGRKFDAINWNNFEIGSRIKTISELYANKVYDESEPMHFNAEGEKQSNFLDGNHISFIISDINSLTEEEFYNKHPYFHPTTGDLYTRNSLLIKKLFEKKGRGEKLRLTILSGVEDESGKGKALSKASEQEVFITRFNAGLQTKGKDAVYSILENADGSLDWALQLGRYVEPENFENETMDEIVKNYILDEIGFAIAYHKGESADRAQSEILATKPTLITGETRTLGKSLQFFAPILGQDEAGLNLVKDIHSHIDAIDTTNSEETSSADQAQAIFQALNIGSVARKYFMSFAQLEANKDKEYLQNNSYIQQLEEGKYDFYNVDGNYFKERFGSGATELSDYGIQQVLMDRQVNYIIHNMEMFKVFFGNPAYYKDGMKRFKSFMSPRLNTQNSDALNEKLNEVENKVIPYYRNSAKALVKGTNVIDLPKEDATYHEFSSEMSFYSVSDITTFNEVVGKAFDNYYTNESTDGQMAMGLSHVKELLIKAGGKWTAEQEAELQLNNAYMRLKLSAKNNPRGDGNFYTYSSEGLRLRDLALLEPYLVETGETPSKNKYDLPALGYISIIKPIQTGFKQSDDGIQEPSLIKTSVAPLTWQMVEGTKMENPFLDMFLTKTSGLAYKSAHKVGQSVKNGKAGKLVNVNGSINYPSDISVREVVPFSTIGVQVETQGQKDKSTVGTQIMKLLTADVYNAGVPRDFAGEEESSFDTIDKWNKLTKEEKIAASNLYKLDQNHYQALSDIFNINYNSFLKKFGITENTTEVIDNKGEVTTETSFDYESMEALHKEITNYVEKHGVPTHVLEQFQLNDDKSAFKVPLEMMQDYKTIKYIIYSIVDKNVLSPKLNGGQKIQMSSALLDKLNHSYQIYFRPKKSKDAWTLITKDNVDSYDEDKHDYVVGNTTLKFYEKGSANEDGTVNKTSRMQVMISSRMKRELNAYRDKRKDMELLTDAQLISYLEKNEPKLLEGVGFRIPTQALSSVDAFEIIGFLPEYMGDAIAVPAELPTKAGSDFDVDKLTTYLNNYRINKKGFPEYLQFKDTMEETEDFYKEEYYEMIQTKIEELTDSKKAYFRDKFIETVKAIQEADAADTTLDEVATEEIVYFAGRFDEKIYSILDDFESDEEAMENMARQIIEIKKKVEKLSDADFIDAGAQVYADKYLKKAIENRYFQSIADLVLTPENYEKLTSPNSSSEFEVDSNPDSITNRLLALRGVNKKDKSYNPAKYLSFTQMVKSRSIYTQAKDKVGISAVGGTSHANFQRFMCYTNLNKKQADAPLTSMVWIGSPTIKFKHNAVQVGDRKYPTVSSILKSNGTDNILEYISKYTNGSVDVTKDDWLIKYGAYGEAFPVAILAEKYGMDSYEIGLMINHPLVKEYMRIQALKKSPVFKYNKVVNEEFGGLYSDSDYLEYFTSLLGVTYDQNFETFGQKEIKALENHIKAGGEYADVTTMIGTHGTSYDTELAITNLRQFLQLKELSFDLLAVVQSSNHETVHLNSSAIIPTKEANYKTLMEKTPFRAVYSRDNNGVSELVDVPAPQGMRENSFVGSVVTNLNKTHNILHDKLFLPQSKALIDYVVGYLSLNNDKLITVDKVAAAVDRLEDISINAQIHSAKNPEGFVGFPNKGKLKTNIHMFEKNSPVFKLIQEEVAKTRKKSEKQKADDGTLVLDYLELVPIENSGYWYMKVKGKPKSSDLHFSNVFYQALRTMQVKNPRLFSSIMMASILQSGISFNDNNITNFLNPDIFYSLSEGVRNFELNNFFFNQLTDLYVANNYFDKENSFVTKMEFFPTIPSIVDFGKNKILLDNRTKLDNEAALFNSLQPNENAPSVVLLPSHKYSKQIVGKKKQKDGSTRNEWSKESYHKINWGAGKPYIVVRKWDKKAKKNSYVILKKTNIVLETKTQNQGEFDKTEFFVYQKLPLRGTKYHSEYHLPGAGDPESANSMYIKDNPKLKLRSDEEIFEHLQNVANQGGIKASAGNTDKTNSKENPDYQEIVVDNIVNRDPANYLTYAVPVESRPQQTNKREYFSEAKLAKQGTFRGKPVVNQEIKTAKDTPVGAQNSPDKITVNIPLLKQKFAEKAWTKPAVQKGGSKAQPLRENEFKSFEEFFTFVLIHETKHDEIKRQLDPTNKFPVETPGAYETRINNAALKDLRSFYKPIIEGRENFNEKEPDPNAPRVGDDDTINIWAGTNENVVLSNLTARPFTVGGVKYKNVEQGFQHAKYAYSPANDFNQDIADKIVAANTGGEARKLGQQFDGLEREKWNKEAASVMKTLISESFKQNPESAKALLATGDATLTHKQDTGTWKTEFPRILMEVRAELQADPSVIVAPKEEEAPFVADTPKEEPKKTGLAAGLRAAIGKKEETPTATATDAPKSDLRAKMFALKNPANKPAIDPKNTEQGNC